MECLEFSHVPQESTSPYVNFERKEITTPTQLYHQNGLWFGRFRPGHCGRH